MKIMGGTSLKMMLQLVGVRDILGKLGENLVAEDWRQSDGMRIVRKRKEKKPYIIQHILLMSYLV